MQRVSYHTKLSSYDTRGSGPAQARAKKLGGTRKVEKRGLPTHITKKKFLLKYAFSYPAPSAPPPHRLRRPRLTPSPEWPIWAIGAGGIPAGRVGITPPRRWKAPDRSRRGAFA